MAWQKNKYERYLMSKDLAWKLLQNFAILKPKNKSGDIWNSNGDIQTVGKIHTCFATHFVTQKSTVSVWEIAGALHICFDPFQLSSYL